MTGCTHGKRLYETRKIARDRIRHIPGEQLRAYRCSDVEGYWHIGHLPDAVKKGEITARQIYGRPR